MPVESTEPTELISEEKAIIEEPEPILIEDKQIKEEVPDKTTFENHIQTIDDKVDFKHKSEDIEEMQLEW